MVLSLQRVAFDGFFGLMHDIGMSSTYVLLCQVMRCDMKYAMLSTLFVEYGI